MHAHAHTGPTKAHFVRTLGPKPDENEQPPSNMGEKNRSGTGNKSRANIFTKKEKV